MLSSVNSHPLAPTRVCYFNHQIISSAHLCQGMASMLATIKRRHSAFDFTDKSPSDAAIKRILEAGRWAPSAGNLQPWYFVVVKNKLRIEHVTSTCSYYAFYGAHGQPRVLVAVVLDRNAWLESTHRGPADGLLGTPEAMLCAGGAVMAMTLAAEDEGIHSCILTPDEQEIAAVLDIRRGDSCPVIICFGYEKRTAFRRQRSRKALKDIVFFEQFGKPMVKTHD